MKPVIIVGGGLAGLACARSLHRAGIPFTLLEASDRIGGRLKSDKVDGFTFDHGFQVYFTAYRTGSAELDYPKLKLRSFGQGAQIYREGNLHLIDRSNPAAMAITPFLGFADKMRLLNLVSEARGLTVSQVWRLNDMPTQRLLRRKGFSEDFMTRFARPFFGGIFLGPSLQVSCRMFFFVLKMLVEGEIVLPSDGIEAIPKQIAGGLRPAAVRTNTRVDALLEKNGQIIGIRTGDGEELEGAAVVIATEADEASRLSKFPTVEGHRESTCLYFEAPEPPIEENLIVLNGSGAGLVNQVVPITNIAPEYAPFRRHLVSATLLGPDSSPDEELAEQVKREVSSWFPEKGVPDWRFIKAYRIPYAQMPQPPGFKERLPSNCPGLNGLYFAGEFTTNSSINGALESGLECARLLRQDLART